MICDCYLPAPAGTSSGSSSGTTKGAVPRVRPPLSSWKYVRPPNLTVPRIDALGQQLKFCPKCRYRSINTVGIYQLSHFNADHIDNHRRPVPAPPIAPAAAPTAPGPDDIAPQSNMTSVANPNPIPRGPPDVSL